MNLTVGPLPPAVYWRRRAVVAGVLLVLVLLVTYACGGSSGSGAAGQPRANTGPATATGTADPSSTELRPQTGAPPSVDPSAQSLVPSVAPAPGFGGPPVSGSAAAQSDFCADSEIQVTPSAKKIVGGTYPYVLTLRIKNISDRTCKRDVGADPQELHVVANGQTLWSSDSCQTTHGQPDVRSFPPGIEDMFTIGWDGTIGTACNNKTAATPGTYLIVGKLDTKVSDPVPFTVG
jgi:hypothetical protein